MRVPITHLKYYAVKRIEDAGAYTDDPDAPNRFLPSLCAGLAFQLALKRAPDRIQALKMLYEDVNATSVNRRWQHERVLIFLHKLTIRRCHNGNMGNR